MSEDEYKEEIRTWLQMIDDHVDQLNEHALQFIDKKETRRMTSLWRWYISHGYFKQGDKKPEFPFSNPPITWLHGQLKGMTVPLERDIGRCMELMISSGIQTEGAARRIGDRLKAIYWYISPEDEKAYAEKKHKEKVEDKIKTKKHTEYVASLREKEREKRYTPEYIQKIADDAMKLKNKQRAEAKKRHEEAKRESLRKFKEETERLKRIGTQT